MPEPFFVLAAMVIVAGTFSSVMKHLFLYLRSRSAGSQEAEGASLSKSELARLIHDAVEEANRPLVMELRALKEQQREIAEGEASVLPRPLLDEGEGEEHPSKAVQPARQLSR